jgi:hypothetical protein
MMGYVKLGAHDPGVPRGCVCPEEERRERCAEKGEQVGGIPNEGWQHGIQQTSDI